MKKATAIFLCLLLVFFAGAQTTFTTIVPQTPVTEGESFQVQYVVDDGTKATNFNSPVFDGFKVVTGPIVYPGTITTGGKTRQSKNFVFTLFALRKGRLVIPAAFITIDGKVVSSGNNFIRVIAKEDVAKQAAKELTGNPDYFLRPGENVQEKIKQNLFVKVMVDKRNCYVGEPVMATFKLYSRLESKSDIVKNPGFYGFTIYDMVNLADKQVSTEYIKGKPFDVHTIRKVQLYPLRAGQFTIDAMEVNNKVEFSRSAVNKKTEQEIVEGVNRRIILPINDENSTVPKDENTTIVETDISTEPITIDVKPVPEKNKPVSYAGAVGKFSISSSVTQPSLKRNEEGFFEVTVSGKGNFIQLGSPTVQWPSGMEGFEPAVKDVLDKTAMPLKGSRTFRYPFTCAAAGNWQLPVVSFSFFDIDSNTFKTISASGATVSVSTEEKKNTTAAERKNSIAVESEKAARTGAIIVIAVVAVILLYWLFRKKETDNPANEQPAKEIITAALPETTGIEDFYSTLHQSAWKFLSQRFHLHGSEMNKQVLTSKMNNAGITTATSNELMLLLQQCEEGMFTPAELMEDKNELLGRMKELLENINSKFEKKG